MYFDRFWLTVIVSCYQKLQVIKIDSSICEKE